MRETRVLSAVVFDTLELSALAFGGIGRSEFFDHNRGRDCPVCVYGHAEAATNQLWFEGGNEIAKELGRARIGVIVNDMAVRQINRKKRRPDSARVSFKEWCDHLNVVRGAAATPTDGEKKNG